MTNSLHLTDDPSDPRLTRGIDETPKPMSEVYLVLSEDERTKGFVRPYRRSYVHVGALGPQFPLLDLTPEQEEQQAGSGYVKYEPYPESESPKVGRYWTQKALDEIGKGCGEITTMGQALAETYARQPDFYGATYCATCQKHRPVSEFVWYGTQERVGS